MLFRASLLIFMGAGIALTLGCSTTIDVFRCETNADCASADNAGGQCELTSLCSFTDPSCAAEGRRYGEGAGDLSNECVAGEEPDASTITETPDASSGQTTDAMPPEADASPITLPPDANAGCANISLTVYDDNDANDKLKIRVGNTDIHICQGDAVPPGMDTVAQCEFCVDIGTDIKLSWFEGSERITEFTTNCHDPCPILDKLSCDFTVTEACSATGVFDTDFPTP